MREAREKGAGLNVMLAMLMMVIIVNENTWRATQRIEAVLSI
jgi:hypothetical protein